MVALKRAKVNEDMLDPIADRVSAILNELVTRPHPPLLAHPNIIRLLGIDFETEIRVLPRMLCRYLFYSVN